MIQILQAYDICMSMQVSVFFIARVLKKRVTYIHRYISFEAKQAKK
jgi:hypothetical protein